MTFHEEPITVLSEDESWYLLATMTLGRLVTVVAGQPEIFPVNFVVQRPTVLFRTAEGRKLLSSVMDERVAFEADDHDFDGGWSVVVKGRADAMSDPADLEKADGAQLLPWTPTVKAHMCASWQRGSPAADFGFEPSPNASARDGYSAQWI